MASCRHRPLRFVRSFSAKSPMRNRLELSSLIALAVLFFCCSLWAQKADPRTVAVDRSVQGTMAEIPPMDRSVQADPADISASQAASASQATSGSQAASASQAMSKGPSPASTWAPRAVSAAATQGQKSTSHESSKQPNSTLGPSAGDRVANTSARWTARQIPKGPVSGSTSPVPLKLTTDNSRLQSFVSPQMPVSPKTPAELRVMRETTKKTYMAKARSARRRSRPQSTSPKALRQAALEPCRPWAASLHTPCRATPGTALVSPTERLRQSTLPKN